MAALLLSGLPAPAAEVVVEGFENVAKLRPTGKVTVVSGADAVTEGENALQLFPGSLIEIRIPARAVKRPGWLKIDTFEPQPVLACLGVSLRGAGERRGYVLPGKDTLAVPLSVLASAGSGPWPAKPVGLRVSNRGRHPVVLDNVRLIEPPPVPKGALLLDFGPPSQTLWPGFEPAKLDTREISWSGDAKIYSFSGPYPDPLLGDFTGKYPGYKVSETVTLRPGNALALAWIWVTHYGYQYSPSLEYMVKVGGKVSLRRRVGPPQMLSREGLLAGKDEAWTTEWFERTFVPRVVSKLECPLKAGDNRLQLANCQLAALIMIPRTRQGEMRKYVQQLEENLKRYRRQFVLATQDLPRCDVVPTEEETRTGVMLFTPPANDWFYRKYVPRTGHRGKALRMVAAAGSSATAAVVAVPCRDGKLLQPGLETLRNPGKGSIPLAGCHVRALETVPVVENAAVQYQSYLPARSFRGVQARGVYWFLIHVSVPERAPTGRFRGAIRLMFDQSVAKLPVEVDVFNIGPAPAGREPTWGLLNTPALHDVYRSLANALPPPRVAQLTRDILSRLTGAGFNASLAAGPSLGSKTYAPVTVHMAAAMKNRLRIEGRGKALIDVTRAVRILGGLQPGTNRYQKVLGDVVRETNRLGGKHGIKGYALYCGSVGKSSDVPDMSGLVRAVRKARGSPAILANGQALRLAGASALSELFGPLDTLIVTDSPRLLPVTTAFKRSSPHKTLGLLASHPDPYAYGFYCWGIGAHGAYAGRVFSTMPLFNAFRFSGDTLLVPTSSWGFEPTLSLLRIAEGMADYDLARRCAAIATQAKKRKINADGLESVLNDIRATADGTSLHFDPSRLRSRDVPPAKLQEWREKLLREANKLVEPPASKPS